MRSISSELAKAIVRERVATKPVKRKPPVPAHPFAEEREYQRFLHRIVASLTKSLTTRLIPKLKGIVAEAGQEQPRSDAWDDEVEDAIKGIGVEYEREWTPSEIKAAAQRRGESIAAFNRKATAKQFKRVLGLDLSVSEPWLQAKLGAWAVENSQLIESIRERFVSKVSTLTLQGLQQGRRHEEIAKDLLAVPGISERQANLIARDQTSKLNANLNQSRQTQVGISKYIWSTSLDERVRGNPAGKYPNAEPSHWAHEGKIYSWNSQMGDPDHPGESGHPGEDIQCRCVALPVIESIQE